MNTNELRSKLLEYGPEMVRMYGEAAIGKSTFYGTVDKARDEVWSVVRELITSATTRLIFRTWAMGPFQIGWILSCHLWPMAH